MSFKKKTMSGGLITSDGLSPRYFQIAGADERYFDANAEIVGDKVILENKKVLKPRRYTLCFYKCPYDQSSKWNGVTV